MRSTYKVLAGLMVASLASVASAAVFPGNGASGFGGPLGNGNLAITEDGLGNLTFTLNPAGSNFGGNHVVVYLDTAAGGITDTSTLTDEQDGGRRNISGVFTNNPNNGGATNRSLVQFAPGFDADFAISFETGSFAGVFDLDGPTGTPSNFQFVGGNGIGNDGPYVVTINRSALGLGPTASFDFVGSLVAGSIYRSNETLGAGLVTTPPADGGGNAGFNGTVTFSNALTYSVPEPASLGLLGLASLGLINRRRRA